LIVFEVRDGALESNVVGQGKFPCAAALLHSVLGHIRRPLGQVPITDACLFRRCVSCLVISGFSSISDQWTAQRERSNDQPDRRSLALGGWSHELL